VKAESNDLGYYIVVGALSRDRRLLAVLKGRLSGSYLKTLELINNIGLGTKKLISLQDHFCVRV